MRLLFAVVAALCLAGCSKSEPPQPPPTPITKAKDPAAARELVAAGATVIDVRSAEEFSEAHLPNAVNVPVQDLPTRLSEVATLVGGDKTRPIVVYCAAGGRAAKAKTQLDAAGYSRVINGGGLDHLR
ncbi:MAG: rhodanese-like domain-containing protein [Kofleriaceae bacterium]